MAPLVNAAARDRVRDYVGHGATAGADRIVDGRDVRVEGHAGGFYLGPTLFDNATTDMSVYTDEIFGPVTTTCTVPKASGSLPKQRSSPPDGPNYRSNRSSN